MADLNLGFGKAALQSSFSSYSHQDEACRLTEGSPTGSYKFHTDQENSPWWMIDLGQICAISSIKVYNRCETAQYRARFLKIEIFNAAVGGWDLIYQAENDFGGLADDLPLALRFIYPAKIGQYLKIGLTRPEIFHLDHVEIMGSLPQECYEASILFNEHHQSFIDDLIDEPSGPPGRGAIVALVRGYPELADYEALIARNASIFEKINRHAKTHYPLVIWHEGDITLEQQAYILKHDRNDDVRFVDISHRFKLPPSVQPSDLKEHWQLGYRLMCKLHTWDIWQLAGEFDYILRIDEDCILRDIVSDPFQWMSDEKLDCAFSLLINDSHQLTNDTLPVFIGAFSRRNDISCTRAWPPTSCFPYTNVYMARTAFFRQDNVAQLLRSMVLERDFYISRWGDHIALGAALNLFSEDAKMKPIKNLQYGHESHKAEIVADDLLRQSYSVKIASASCHSAIQNFMEWPLSQHARSAAAFAVLAAGHTETAARLLAGC